MGLDTSPERSERKILKNTYALCEVQEQAPGHVIFYCPQEQNSCTTFASLGCVIDADCTEDASCAEHGNNSPTCPSVQSWRRCMNSMWPATFSSGPCKEQAISYIPCEIREMIIVCFLVSVQCNSILMLVPKGLQFGVQIPSKQYRLKCG